MSGFREQILISFILPITMHNICIDFKKKKVKFLIKKKTEFRFRDLVTVIKIVALLKINIMIDFNYRGRIFI